FWKNTDMVKRPRSFQGFYGNIAINRQFGSTKIQADFFYVRQLPDILFKFRGTTCTGQVFKTVCLLHPVHLLSHVHVRLSPIDERDHLIRSNTLVCLSAPISPTRVLLNNADGGKPSPSTNR